MHFALTGESGTRSADETPLGARQRRGERSPRRVFCGRFGALPQGEIPARIATVPTTHRQLKLFPERVDSGRVPDFNVRRSTRAKRLTIKVYPGGRVEVVVPRRVRAGEVQAFVRENTAWIRDARQAFGFDDPTFSSSVNDALALLRIEQGRVEVDGKKVRETAKHETRLTLVVEAVKIGESSFEFDGNAVFENDR